MEAQSTLCVVVACFCDFSIMYVDRTAEFLAVLSTLGASSTTTPTPTSISTPISTRKYAPLSSGALHAVPETRSAFLRAAGEVSGDLHSTAAKLAALTRLVKRRGVFTDVGEEIDRLTGAVKEDMEALTQRLDILQEFVTRHKAAADAGGWKAGQTRTPHGAGTHHSAHSPHDGNDDVLSTVQGISHGSVIITQMRGTLLNFTKSLRGILASRSETVKQTTQRMTVFGRQKDLGRPIGQRDFDRPLSDGHAHSAAAEDVVVDMRKSFAQVSAQELVRDNETDYLAARADDVQAIERHMNDLSQMFTRLASVVSEQGAMVERIEDNLHTAERDLESGMSELHKFRERVFSNKMLALKITGIVVLFIIFFVLFGT